MSAFTIGVFASVFDSERRILCVKQAYGRKHWAMPGGGLEQNEDPRDGVLRELYEETGFIGTVKKLRGVYVEHRRSPNDLVFLFDVEATDRHHWQPDDEISDVRFFGLDELPPEMSSTARKRFLDSFEDRSFDITVYQNDAK